MLYTWSPHPELARLRTLDLSAVALRLSGQLPELLPGLCSLLTRTNLPGLRDLDLSQHRDDVVKVEDFLCPLVEQLACPRLRLRDLALPAESWRRVATLSALAQVEDLDLSASEIPQEILGELFARMPNLRRLRMRRMPSPVPRQLLPQELAWLDLGPGGVP
jgi:hypothetical protein